MLPYSSEILFSLLIEYNQRYWIVTLLFIVGLIGSLFYHIRSKTAPRLVICMLGLSWIWLGIFYYFYFLNQLYFGAPYYGIFYVIQGSLFLIAALRMNHTQSENHSNSFQTWWWGMVASGIIGYPLVDLISQDFLWGIRLPGIIPEPTLLLTIAVLGLFKRQLPGYLILMPILFGIAEIYNILALGNYLNSLIPFSVLILAIQLFSTRSTSSASS